MKTLSILAALVCIASGVIVWEQADIARFRVVEDSVGIQSLEVRWPGADSWCLVTEWTIPDTGDTTPPPPPEASYYVSPDGDDTNPGTYELPFRTIQAGINAAYAGDTVLVLAGVYNEHLTFPRSGVAGLAIVLQGEVDADSNPLVVIDNSTPVGTIWEPAPEIGAGVYRAELSPALMFYQNYKIIRLNSSCMAGNSSSLYDDGFTTLAYPPDKTFSFYHGAYVRPFWDYVEVLYGVLGGTTYVRFRDGDDPDTCDLTYTNSRSATITFTSVDYITVEGFKIQGTYTGVKISNSDHNIVQNCDIRHGYRRIELINGSAYNLIQHNRFTLGYGPWGFFGAWGQGNDSSASACAMYHLQKYHEGGSATVDQGVKLYCAGEHNEVCYNELRSGGIALWLWGTTNARIHHNTIANFSSIGVLFFRYTDSLYVHDNYFYDINISIRFQQVCYLGDRGRVVFVYRNRFYGPRGGLNLRPHSGGYDYTDPLHAHFYHNSYAGPGTCIKVTANECVNYLCVNEVYSKSRFPSGVGPTGDTIPSNLAGFDYCFVGGNYRGYRSLDWSKVDSHNIMVDDAGDVALYPYDNVMYGSSSFWVWPTTSEPGWTVPDTSLAYRSGIDLSQPFTIRGITYDPLPGMTEGYFSGDKPNLGATQ